jgi:hypothetical protein
MFEALNAARRRDGSIAHDIAHDIAPHSSVRKGSALLAEQRSLPLLPELDHLLPGGGLDAGSLIDLHADLGVGALTLAFRIAAHRQHESARTIAVIDPTGSLYGAGLAAAGIELEHVLLLRPPAELALATLDEVLRSKAVAVTVARVRGLEGSTSHRLRIAALVGGGFGVLVRPREERTLVSGAALRLVVSPAKDGLVLEPLRVRGGPAVGTWRLT